MKIFLDMVGCRLNQAEIEQMARQFRAEGHSIVSTPAEADTVVLNTCSVTTQAASDSRQKIRQASRAGAREIFVTGCWSTLQPNTAAEMPNVVSVIPNNRKDTLVQDLLKTNPSFAHASPIIPQADDFHFDQEPIARIPIPGLRQRTRAFIKVQDGCDNACTFCITTVARGQSHSRPASEVIADIRAARNGGAKEIVLTGVHLGSWGQDFSKHLSHLIQSILQHTDVPRLRLSSLEPWDLDDEFFALWEDPRLCPNLHLPLQSGSAATLKRMLRKTTPAAYMNLVTAARKYIPGVAITTDVIAGFPGESESEFAETHAFIREVGFAGGHVFTYSARQGTPAARIKEQIPLEVKKQRNQALRDVFTQSGLAYRQDYIGKTTEVLWEASSSRTPTGWKIEGLTGNYIRVKAIAPQPKPNTLDMVKLTAIDEDGMMGEILPAGQ